MNNVTNPRVEDLDVAGESAALNQIRVYLIRAGTELPGGAIRAPEGDEAPEVLPIASHGLRGYLVMAAPPPRRPDWLPFLEGVLEDEIRYDGNQHISAVLLVERDERTFALTFGFGRHLLEPEALESDFGLRTAAGLIDPSAIASVDSRAFEATVLQVRRQSSRGTGTRGIGLDVGREMLRAIAGELLDESVGTRVTGSDSLGLTASLEAAELGPRLDLIGAAYGDRRYRTSFGYLDRWQRLKATDPVRADLDQILLDRLDRRWQVTQVGADVEHLPAGAGGLVLTVPQIIEFNSSGFLTSRERDAVPHAFPDLDAYLRAIDHAPTLNDLRRNHDLLLMAGEPFAVEGRWPLYSALTLELEHQDESYVLMDGTWWRIDGDYQAQINARVTDIALVDWLPDFDPIEDEGDYNRRVVNDAPESRALIDRLTVRYEDEEGGVEPCDVFTSNRQFVHAKRLTGSDAMSHLFAQALVSARLYLSTRTFRDFLRDQMSAKPALAALMPGERPVANEHTVTLAIISSELAPLTGPIPHIGLSLPFLARTFLFHIAGQIEELDYRLEMARVPVTPGARPTTAGEPDRFREGVDPHPNRWGTQRRRRRRRRAQAAPTEA